MKKNMRWILTLVLCCDLLAIAIGAPFVMKTMSYLSDKGPTKTNVFSIGNVTTNVVEDFSEPSEVPVNEWFDVQKDVKISNDGYDTCYIRVWLEFSNEDIKDVSEVYANGKYQTLDALKTAAAAGGYDWVYVPSGTLGGYFYYTKPVAPGATTTSLIHGFRTRFETASDTEYAINYRPKEHDVWVYSESVQVMKLDGSGEHSNYQDAWTAFLNQKG